MIGNGSLSLKANERTPEREREQWKERTAKPGRKSQKFKRKQGKLLTDIAPLNWLFAP
jgi:predicted RNA-binding protein with RPS1 domain